MEAVYSVRPTQEACSQKGVKPLSTVVKVLSEESPSLYLDCSEVPLNDNDFFSLSVLLKSSPPHLTSLEICSTSISELSLQHLAEGLESNIMLKKLRLSRLSIGYSRSFVALIAALQENSTLECLNLSENNLNDDTGSFISCLIELNSQLRVLVLDNNKFKSFSFALSLTKNKSLLHFSISNNPLEFVSMISLLEMLTINKTLQHLGVNSIEFKGPAPIKENPSGLLGMNEAILLKLANVLRYSYVYSIGIDLQQDAALQINELETSILKHNRTLIKIESALINWNNAPSAFLGILKGLQANKWLRDREGEMPKELEEVITMKLNHKKLANENSLRRYSPSPKKPQKPRQLSRKDSTESKNSDSTVIENKHIKEMSFGKSALNQHLAEEGSFYKYLSSLNEKIQHLESNFMKYTEKTDSYMERIEKELGNSQKPDEISNIGIVLKDIQARLENFEKDKNTRENIIEEYMQRLEAVKFDAMESSRRSSHRLRPQEKIEKDTIEFNELHSFEGTNQSLEAGAPKGRLALLEERIQKLEFESLKVKKTREKFNGAMDKVVRLENFIQDNMYTPKKPQSFENRNMKSYDESILPEDVESVVMGALLEKARFSRMNESSYRSKSPMTSAAQTKRAPSSELKQCLKSRGFDIEGDRPVYKRFN